jgi:hypothetical protein
MIEATKAQFLKYVVGAMVVVDMKPMPPKTIGRNVCLWARGLFGLSKDPKPKRHLNT